MKFIYTVSGILLILLFLNLPVKAQFQEKIDSLLHLLHAAPEDTNKVNIYSELSWNYGGLRSETGTSRAYADSTLKLSEKLQFEKGIMQSHLCYGMINRYEGNFDQALRHLNTYVQYHKEVKNQTKEARGWYEIGTVEQQLGNYDKALDAYQYVLNIYEENEDWNRVAATLNGIGIIYKRNGKYEQAIQGYKKALAVVDSFNIKKELTYILMNIGISYAMLEQYDQALPWFQKSISTCYESGNQHGLALNLANMGELYGMMDQHDKALQSHLKALRIRENLPQKRNLTHSLVEIGLTYTRLQNYKLAEDHLKRGLALAQEIKTKGFIRDAYEYLGELYAATENYKKGYEFRELYHAYNDSILNEEKVKHINELQTKYETAEKDKQITLLAKEKEIQTKEAQRQATLKNAFIGGGALLTLVGALFLLMFSQRLKNQKAMAMKNDEIKNTNFKQQLGELENKALRSQMNPHFIFNCMNSIDRMILSGDIDGSSIYLSKFAKLIRLMLENSEKPTVPLEKELNMLESYIQLESLTNKGKIRYEISVDPEIDQEAIHIPSMVLQPFIENAIWHGLMNKKEEGQISIIIKEDQDLLKCMIEDNGIGREKALELKKQAILKNKSMGLSITQKRLQLLSKEALREMVQFTDLKGPSDQPLGTRVDVLIPIS